MSDARCPHCGRDADTGVLRCECGVLRMDRVRELRDEDAESLIASNDAWLAAEVSRGRRMVGQGVLAGLLPTMITVIALSFGAVAAGAVFGTCTLGAAAWGYRGQRRIATARRIAAANQIALPAARVHRSPG